MSQPIALRKLKELKSIPALLEQLASQAQCVVRLLQVDGTALEECVKGPQSSAKCFADPNRSEIVRKWLHNKSSDDITCYCGHRMTILPIERQQRIHGLLTVCPAPEGAEVFWDCIAQLVTECLDLASTGVDLWGKHAGVLSAHNELYTETEFLLEDAEVARSALTVLQKYINADAALYLSRNLDGAGWGAPVMMRRDPEFPEDCLQTLALLVMSSHDEGNCPQLIREENEIDYPQFSQIHLTSLISTSVSYEGETLGRLVMCSRRPDRLLPVSDWELLDNLARIIGLRVHDLRSRKLRERFLSRALHQIYTPVHSVREIARVLVNKKLSDEERDSWLTDLNQEAERLARLSEEAREYSTWQRKSRPRNQVSLNELVEQLSGSFSVLANQRQVTIETEVPADNCEVIADSDALYGALQCLIENALKFSPPGGSIAIVLVMEDGRFRLSVVDEGRGVSENHRDEVFDEFVSIAAHGVPEGAGLGLTIAREVAEAHGGRLEYLDRPGRQGACFSLTIPRPL